jgi:UDP-N-acetylmuramyl pentapeptide synthase
MMLTYRFVKKLFPMTRGIVDEMIQFHHLFTDPMQKTQKGLFVPLEYKREDLKIAIEHGAIAALWKQDVSLPAYVPNHFPIFFVSSPIEALVEIVETYLQSDELENGKMTRFYLKIDKVHNEENDSYDIAVINKLQRLEKQLQAVQREGRGE